MFLSILVFTNVPNSLQPLQHVEVNPDVFMVNDQTDSCSHQVSLGGFVSRVELKGVNGPWMF